MKVDGLYAATKKDTKFLNFVYIFNQCEQYTDTTVNIHINIIFGPMLVTVQTLCMKHNDKIKNTYWL